MSPLDDAVSLVCSCAGLQLLLCGELTDGVEVLLLDLRDLPSKRGTAREPGLPCLLVAAADQKRGAAAGGDPVRDLLLRQGEKGRAAVWTAAALDSVIG